MRAASFLAVTLSLSLLSSLSLTGGGCSTTGPGAGGGTPTGAGGAISVAGVGGAGVGGGLGGSAAGGAGGAPTAGGDAGTGVPATDETLCGDVQLAASKTVAAGKSLTICAGTTVTMPADATFTVQGTLTIQGTAQSPVKLIGAQGGTTDWGGLAVDAGGTLSATYLELRNAKIALAARPGASFDVDHIVIESSDALMILSSSGSIAHGTLRGLGDSQSSTPVFISNASPRITDTSITQAQFGGIDMVVVGGPAAAPVFDRVEVADSHCAFHFGASNGAIISNSYVHHNSYGFMVNGSLAGQVLHNNFQDNDVNIGSCLGGAVEEVKDNYFAGAAFGDGSCAGLAVTGTSPSGPYLSGVGPTP